MISFRSARVAKMAPTGNLNLGRLPRDLSMVVLDAAEFLTWLNPTPTRYRYKKEQAFRHFRS